MGKYWSQQNIINEDWVAQRMGYEFLEYRKNLSSKNPAKIRSHSILKKYIEIIRHRLLILISSDKNIKSKLELARFRSGGEIHQWMYDSFSLSNILTETGFYNVEKVDEFTSGIPDWNKYNMLDIENGKIRKPDSLFIEAIK
jgi:hypothetical protein